MSPFRHSSNWPAGNARTRAVTTSIPAARCAGQPAASTRAIPGTGQRTWTGSAFAADLPFHLDIALPVVRLYESGHVDTFSLGGGVVPELQGGIVAMGVGTETCSAADQGGKDVLLVGRGAN